ncbi:GRAM domain family protein [Perilla frutescens var. hirtella]|uniref:GRAM domain family protein n=1 Tax=Perilla frutescens var. hirtella TaxID=608512 RepID=A0AAD4IYP8_PERFH|nr:GRAM domain family protein [Perilla frutescens var. hirtella]KAH6811325.1 GRAM domain family protein [Perilla frutescens var. frutescens]KAH6823744.1 GRAM domain family protein [Perilla frutescens var. hirtella]
MSGQNQESQPIQYPDISSSTAHPPPPPSSENPPPYMEEMKPNPFPGPSSSSSSSSENAEKWGTHVMGTPAVPTCHPNNQKAALWGVADQKEYQNHHQPYVQYTPIERNTNSGPFDSVLQKFNSWSAKAETTANNIWHNLKTGSSVSGAAWGKVNLRAKTITGGGFETLYKQTFATYPNEVLKKSFACYLSTSTGPVAGTLYLSNVHVAFCSDRPLSFTAPSGQETWSYYKILVPLANIGSINPVVMRETPTERYIQLVSTDGHDFWFMGFVNYEKATNHLFDSISKFAAAGVPVTQPAPAPAPDGGKHA